MLIPKEGGEGPRPSDSGESRQKSRGIHLGRGKSRGCRRPARPARQTGGQEEEKEGEEGSTPTSPSRDPPLSFPKLRVDGRRGRGERPRSIRSFWARSRVREPRLSFLLAPPGEEKKKRQAASPRSPAWDRQKPATRLHPEASRPGRRGGKEKKREGGEGKTPCREDPPVRFNFQ